MPRVATKFDWENDLGCILRMSRRAKNDPALAPESSEAIDTALRGVVAAIVNRKVVKAPAKAK